MRFKWIPYCADDAGLVDSWLDDHAIRETGLDDGWQHFYEYWMAESRLGEGKDRCFLICRENTPVAVIYAAIVGREITISEYIVAPDQRGMGYGTAILKELLTHSVRLLNIQAALAKAAIFPGNIASVKAFEKAGFVLVSEHRDDLGATLSYEYRSMADFD